MVSGALVKIFTLAILNTFKGFSKIEFEKKSVYLIKETKQVKNKIIKIKITGDIDGHVLMSFPSSLEKELVNDFMKSLDQEPSSIGESVTESALAEIGNTVVAKIQAYLYKLKKKSMISAPDVISPNEVKELNYENILVIEMKTEYGIFEIALGLQELNYKRNINILLYGLNSELVEFLTTKFIPLGFEILSSDDPKILSHYVKTKEIDFFFIDFYIIEDSPEMKLKSIVGDTDRPIKIILGGTKLDLEKIKAMPMANDHYQVVGIYPKTFSHLQLYNHIYKLLSKVGIKPDDRRKHIRVNITEQSRFFIAFKYKGNLVKARIIDLSLGGVKCILDNNEDDRILKVGLRFESVDIFLKYQRLITDCTIVYVKGNTFAVSFDNLVETERMTISKVIFRILSSTA